LRQSLRELVVAFGASAGELLFIDRDTVRFNTDACWIDAVALLSEDPEAENIRGKLAELCNGRLLEELDGLSSVFDRWLIGKRLAFAESLRNLLADRLDEAASSDTKAADREAIARRLIEFDSTHEGASRIIMRSLADRGRRSEALTEYQRLQGALQRAFDTEPSTETRALYEMIRSTDASGVSDNLSTEGGKRIARVELAPKRCHRRVGVMPFRPIPSAVDENLAFSIAQSVAAALARFRWFDVVAPTALMRALAPTFYNDADLRRRDLDYVIDGSVSCSRDNYQISVNLLDLTADATPVWSSQFNIPMDRLDLLDEQVTAPIVAQVDPIILCIEGQAKKNADDDDAVGCVMRAIPLLNSMEREKYEQAGRFLERALALEPENATVLSWAAYWYVYHVGQGWAADPQTDSDRAVAYALRATQLDPKNGEALAIYGHILAFLHKDVSLALDYFDRALKLNRNSAFIWAFSAVSYCYLGDPDTALKRLQRCRELTSSLPYFSLFENPFTIAYLMKKMYAEAVQAGRRVVDGTPAYGNGYKPLISALGHLGRRQDARPYVRKLLEIEPNFTVKRFGQVYPFRNDGDLKHYMDGLRRAGVPAG
jgi:DNA-binding SARP family transcriptional activator/Flp pilus assembly protein TadD